MLCTHHIGCAGILFGYPFDTVKVNIQTQCPKRTLYTGTFHCIRTIIARESVTGLYRGITSPMAGVALVNAIIFGVYGNIQRRSADPNSIRSHFWAGTVAGLAQTVITSPMELAKTRMQLQSHLPPDAQFKGPLECVRHIHRIEGVRGLCRGMGITAIRDVPGMASYFVLYEMMIRMSPCPGAFHTLMAGGMAGMLSWVLSCPIDVVKTRLQADGAGSLKMYSGIIDCTVKSYRAEGLSFLTRGMSSTLMRAFIMNSVCFYVVAYTIKLCDNTRVEIVPAAGSFTEQRQVSSSVGELRTATFLTPPVIKVNSGRRDEPGWLELSRSLNYMAALSDAVNNNEIIELANDLYDDRRGYDDDDDECNYYKLNLEELKDYRSMTGCIAASEHKLNEQLLLSD